LQVQRLLGGLDLRVGEVADDGIHACEGQVDGLKDLGRMLGHNAQIRRQLFVGVGKGVLIGHPACIGKNRNRDGNRGHHHGLQEADGGVASGAHSKP
jgi:hypothetical protein